MVYFHCYHSYRKRCEKLTDQELGQLFRSLMAYSETGVRPELDGRLSIAFDFIADDIDQAKTAYENRCKRNAENGKRGGRPKENENEETHSVFSVNEETEESEKSQGEGERKENKGNTPLPPEGETRALFAAFWDAYPKKKNKGYAETAFAKAIKKTDLNTMLAAIRVQKQSNDWQKEGGQYIPYPATWLNGRGWEDEATNEAFVYVPTPENIPDNGW